MVPGRKISLRIFKKRRVGVMNGRELSQGKEKVEFTNIATDMNSNFCAGRA